MASDATVGFFTLGGVAVGAGLAYLGDRGIWRRSQALQGRLLLAETFKSIWRDDKWGDWQVHTRRLRAYFEAVGVEADLIEELEQAVEACRRHIAVVVEEQSYDPEFGPGLTNELLDRYEKIERKISRALQ